MTPDDVSYDADEAGAKLGRSGDWMKKQARLGKIPCTKVGQSYRWTPAHIREILRLGEQRPKATLAAKPPMRKRAAAAGGEPTLKARTPPRKRKDAA